jgi:hypothetical protein
VQRQEGHRLGQPGGGVHPETAGLLKQNGLKWTCDVTYADLPIKIHTPHGPIAGVPTTDFSDNRVLRASSATCTTCIAARSTICGSTKRSAADPGNPHPVRRPSAHHRGVDRATEIHAEVARCLVHDRMPSWPDWALKQDVDEHTFQSRYFR